MPAKQHSSIYHQRSDEAFYYAGLKEWQIGQKYTRLIDVFLESQDDMKAALDYFRIDYDHTEVTARELINKRK